MQTSNVVNSKTFNRRLTEIEDVLRVGALEQVHELVKYYLPRKHRLWGLTWDGEDELGRFGHAVQIQNAMVFITVKFEDGKFSYNCDGTDFGDDRKGFKKFVLKFFKSTGNALFNEKERSLVTCEEMCNFVVA